jgi:hypothetical protein
MTRIAGIFLVTGTLLLIGGLAMIHPAAGVIAGGILAMTVGALNLERR